MKRHSSQNIGRRLWATAALAALFALAYGIAYEPAPVVPLQAAAPAAEAPPTGPPHASPVMPTRAPAQVPVAAGASSAAPVAAAGLPSRGTGSYKPASEVSEDLDRLAARSQMASSALSELRGLYEPSFTPAVAPAPSSPAGLARRTPGARTPDTAMPIRPQAPTGPARPRTAKEVRGMLSGFRAGVERGRTPSRLDHLVAENSDDSDPTAS